VVGVLSTLVVEDVVALDRVVDAAVVVEDVVALDRLVDVAVVVAVATEELELESIRHTI
jgi:hypothetical protein